MGNEHHVPYALRAESPGDNYRHAYVINNFFWGFGHYFVYDPQTLSVPPLSLQAS